MRIVRFIDDQGQTRLGAPPAGWDPQHPGSVEVLDGDLFGSLKPAGRKAAVRKLLTPFTPVNIFCIGLNYREHAKESNSPIPENPVIFMKPTTAATHPGDPIRIPKVCTDEVDYECELAVVIGKTARDVTEADALSHVLGYTAANDVSARKWQRQGGGGQWIRGKSFDTFCPLGPMLVTAATWPPLPPGEGRGEGRTTGDPINDTIADPQTLRLSTTINGQVLQNHTTGDMIFPVSKLISFLSKDTTLLPGTVILTGTPQGVGFARTPPRWLQPGDQVVVEVEQIGKLCNPVAAG